MSVPFLSGVLILVAWFLSSLAPAALFPASRVQAGCFIVLASLLTSASWSRRAEGTRSHLAIYCFPWIVALCLSAVLGPDPGRGFIPIWDWTFAAVAGLVVSLGLNAQGRKLLVLMLPVLAAIISLLGYHQLFSGFGNMGEQLANIEEEIPDPAFRRDLIRRIADRRAFGPFLLPGVFGCFSGMGLFLAWDGFRRALRPKAKALWTVALVLLLGGLLATRSVSSIAALCLTLALSVIWNPRKRASVGKTLAWTAAGAALILIPIFVRGWSAFIKESVMARWGLWGESLGSMTGSYFVGVGTGRLGDVLGGMQASQYFAHDAHSLLIQAAAEMGWVGLAAGIWMAFGVFRSAKSWSHTSFAGHGLALVFALLHSLIDLSLSQGEIMLFFFLIWGLAEGPPGKSVRRQAVAKKAVSINPIRAADILVVSAGLGPLLFANPKSLPAAALWFSILTCFCLHDLAKAKLGLSGRLAIAALLWALLSAMVQGSAGSGIRGLAFTGLCLLALAVVSAAGLAWEKRYRLFGWSAGLSSAILGLWALFDRILNGTKRSSGLFDNPNLLAAGLLLGLLYTCDKILNGSRSEKIVGVLLFVPALLGLLASGSRGALVCLVLALSLFMIFRKSWISAGVAGVLGLAIILSISSFHRVGDQYANFRPRIWAAAVSAISSEALLGAGPGQGTYLLQTQSPRDGIGPFYFDHKPVVPHSSLLRIGLEAGWPALVLAIVSWGFLWVPGLIRKRRRGDGSSGWVLPLSVMAMGFFALGEEIFFSPGVMANFAVLAGFILAHNISKRARISKEQNSNTKIDAVVWIRAASLVLITAGPVLARTLDDGQRRTPVDPSSPEFWRSSGWKIAEVYLTSNDFRTLPILQKSLMAHDRGRMLAPRDPRFLIQRARLRGAAVGRGHLKQANLDLVWQDYDQAIERGPKDALIPWEAAVQARAFGRNDLALGWAARAIQTEPNFAAPWELAAILQNVFDSKASDRSSKRAVEIRQSLAAYRPENSLCQRMVDETFPPASR